MPAMFVASAAEARSLPIGGPRDGTYASQSQALPHLLIPGFLHFTRVGTSLGKLLPTWDFAECVRNILMVYGN
jgi:hypothetical protein